MSLNPPASCLSTCHAWLKNQCLVAVSVNLWGRGPQRELMSAAHVQKLCSPHTNAGHLIRLKGVDNRKCKNKMREYGCPSIYTCFLCHLIIISYNLMFDKGCLEQPAPRAPRCNDTLDHLQSETDPVAWGSRLPTAAWKRQNSPATAPSGTSTPGSSSAWCLWDALVPQVQQGDRPSTGLLICPLPAALIHSPSVPQLVFLVLWNHREGPSPPCGRSPSSAIPTSMVHVSKLLGKSDCRVHFLWL